MSTLHDDLAFHAAETLAKDRVAALLDAEQENTALRGKVERLRAEVEAERASVVAWLLTDLDELSLGLQNMLIDMADAIERGAHRREENE